VISLQQKQDWLHTQHGFRCSFWLCLVRTCDRMFHCLVQMGVKESNGYFGTVAVLELFQKITVPRKTL
jgi:hypothetical protein